ncbi:MAG: hypothetical protein ACKOXK_08190 [Chakrabartia sp.]
MSRPLLLALGVALALSACGGRVKLKPYQGASLPVKPEEALTQPTVDEMITPTPQARPKRSDELLTRSEERRDDKFDLPPKG